MSLTQGGALPNLLDTFTGNDCYTKVCEGMTKAGVMQVRVMSTEYTEFVTLM